MLGIMASNALAVVNSGPSRAYLLELHFLDHGMCNPEPVFERPETTPPVDAPAD